VRELSWDGFLNVRDLGGLPVRGGGVTVRGSIARSESPGFLTKRGWRELTEHGIRTIVDLRCASEDPYTPVDGIRRVEVPLWDFDDDELWRRGQGMRRKSQYYALWTDYCRGRIARAVAEVGDAPPGGVLVHCHAGRDRTGIVAAVLLGLAGVPGEAIADDYVASMRALQPRYEQDLQAAASELERAEIAHHYEIEGEFILAALEAAGDIRDYLIGAGASEGQVERARARLAP
jgi:protein-tyrosine phosphatase